jgi:hypothetical protein
MEEAPAPAFERRTVTHGRPPHRPGTDSSIVWRRIHDATDIVDGPKLDQTRSDHPMKASTDRHTSTTAGYGGAEPRLVVFRTIVLFVLLVVVTVWALGGGVFPLYDLPAPF